MIVLEIVNRLFMNVLTQEKMYNFVVMQELPVSLRVIRDANCLYCCLPIDFQLQYKNSKCLNKRLEVKTPALTTFQKFSNLE